MHDRPGSCDLKPGAQTQAGWLDETYALLEVAALSVRFGDIRVLEEVSFAVQQGEILSIIGPNGAGKTSLFNCISGAYRPAAGKISFEGRDIGRLRPDRRANIGIARTFQNLALFGQMSVLENILVGRHRLMRGNLLTGALYWAGGARIEERMHRRAVTQTMELLDIAHLAHTEAGALPYGLQKRVELGRAAAMQPKLVLLDEPMAGLNAEEKHAIARCIIGLNRDLGITVLMIEHDVGVVAAISHRVLALDFGCRIALGSPAAVLTDPQVEAAYLGPEE